LERKDLLKSNLKELLKEKKFKNILLAGLKLMKPSKIRILSLIIILIVMIKPSIDIISSNHTLESIISICEFSNDIIKDLFGIIFTGYALFQALIGVNSLKQMLIINIGKYSTFKTYNLYFFMISIIYLSIILLNYILLIIFKNVDTSFINAFVPNNIKNIFEFIFIIGYVTINIFAISEIKSFLVNMYYCFNLSVFSEGIEMVKEYSDEEDKEN